MARKTQFLGDTGTRRVIGWLGLALIHCGLSAQPASRALDLFALKMDAKSSSEQRGRVVKRLESELGARVFDDDMSRRYGLLLIERPEAATPESFALHLRRLETRDHSLTNVPVYVTNDGYLIPTGKIIVELQIGTVPEQARRLFADAGLRVVTEPTTLRPTRYVVESRMHRDFDPISIAANLSRNPKIRFAEVDRLMLSNSRLLHP